MILGGSSPSSRMTGVLRRAWPCEGRDARSHVVVQAVCQGVSEIASNHQKLGRGRKGFSTGFRG